MDRVGHAAFRPVATEAPTLKTLKIGACILVFVLTVLLVTVTLLPFAETKWWVIRLMDFPRVLFGLGLLAVVPALALCRRVFPRISLVVLAAVVLALVADLAVLWPYRPGGRSSEALCAPETSLSVMIANVQLGNREAARLLQVVAAQKPDLFLAMEIDEWWQQALRPVAADMPHQVQEITGSYYGIHLFSRLPLVEPTTRHLADRETPSVITGVTLRNGETLTFVGLHPKPPLPGQSALGRDAELYAAGTLLRQRSGPALLAGDLNATPWEAAVARMRRLASLSDPRRGYGYVASWNANIWWARWPLDNIFYRGDFEVLSLERLPFIGSDHFPYIVRLCRRTGAPTPSPGPESPADEAAVLEAGTADHP